MLKATMTSPRHSKYGVTIYTTEGSEGGPQDWTQPSFYIPCYNYEHARAVAHAYNLGGRKEQPKLLHELIEEDVAKAEQEGRHYLDNPRKD